MNIFVLSNDFVECAKYHNDKHVVKMILESAQMIATVGNENGIESGYRTTHKNHPCTLWAKQSLSNIKWLASLAYALQDEWRHRFSHSKTHASVPVIEKVMSKLDIVDVGLTAFAQAMPDQYRNSDTVTAYRNYYVNEKAHLAKWSNREKPHWWVDNAEVTE